LIFFATLRCEIKKDGEICRLLNIFADNRRLRFAKKRTFAAQADFKG